MKAAAQSAAPRSAPAADRLRRVAGWLLLLSAITHVLQVPVYGTEGNVLGAAGFGVVYALVGTGLLRRWPGAVPAATVLPVIGGTLGVIRFLFLHTNPFSVWHVALDLVIVPLATILLIRSRTGS
ncbi:hypothetical protein [Actinomadura violacea]|uniref:Integral membrane protein n=1 Tax=Actinomadura violacea TaxID=2819934 RepID=A0ABS3S5G8_9ACTN|nr:hypothetical protein [Actinomadura violacea]MBO2464207.1 hypothetical protein [Actinomadura violacea]